MTYYFLDSNKWMGGHAGGRRLPRGFKNVHCKDCGRDLISVIDKDVLCDSCTYERQKKLHRQAREELANNNYD